MGARRGRRPFRWAVRSGHGTNTTGRRAPATLFAHARRAARGSRIKLACVFCGGIGGRDGVASAEDEIGLFGCVLLRHPAYGSEGPSFRKQCSCMGSPANDPISTHSPTKIMDIEATW